jgi:hypothetical protein
VGRGLGSRRGAVAASVAAGWVLLLLVLSGTVVVGSSQYIPQPPHEEPVGVPPGGADIERAAESSSKVTVVVPEPHGTPGGCVEATPANLYPERTEGFLAFQGNLYALPSGSVGETDLCYHSSSGTLSDSTTFVSLPGARQHGVLGYPEAIVGENIYGGLAGKQSANLPLPDDTFGNLTHHDVWVTLNYTVRAPGASPYDFAFDDWFSVDRATSTSTGNVGNRIELMIWVSNDIGMYLSQTRVSVPSYLNGTRAPGTWYRDDLCMGSNDITFDYLFAPNGKAPGYGYSKGALAIDLTSILENLASVIDRGACWASAGTSVNSFYADNFPLGAEFYPKPGDTASVSWQVNRLCYSIVTGPARPKDVNCQSSSSGGPVDLGTSPGGTWARGTHPVAPAEAPRRATSPGIASPRYLERDSLRPVPSGNRSGRYAFGTNSYVPIALTS